MAKEKNNELEKRNQTFLIYQDENGIARVNVRFEGEDVTQVPVPTARSPRLEHRLIFLQILLQRYEYTLLAFVTYQAYFSPNLLHHYSPYSGSCRCHGNISVYT